MREVPARQVRGYHTSLRWSADGQSVEKHYERNFWFLDRRCRPFEKERRIGLLLRRYPPPVRAARLLGVDRSRRVLRFEAIDGGPFGPKYPLAMAPGDLDLLIGSALAMGTYRPRAFCFATRFDLARRLRRAVSGGLLSGSAASRFAEVAAADPPVLVFGHGDLTARNVLRGDAGERSSSTGNGPAATPGGGIWRSCGTAWWISLAEGRRWKPPYRSATSVGSGAPRCWSGCCTWVWPDWRRVARSGPTTRRCATSWSPGSSTGPDRRWASTGSELVPKRGGHHGDRDPVGRLAGDPYQLVDLLAKT